MLIPFSEIKFHSSDFDGKFVASFLNDISRDGEFQNGILICETSNKTGYVLISDGRAVLSRGIAVSDESEVFATVPIEFLLDEEHLELTLAAVENDNVFKYLSDLLVYPNFLCAPYRFVNVPLLVSYFSDCKESALIGFRRGRAMDVVAFDKGNFSFLATFDEGKNGYVFERNPMNFGAYLGNLDISKPMIVGIKISEKLFSSFVFSSGLDFLEKDLVSEEAGVYFNAFSAVFKVFAEILPPENVAALAGKILSYLKGKYQQVCSLLEYSPESGTVNWESLLETRKFVAEEYRFSAYHGYLDEILLLLLRSANSLLKPREMKALELDIRVLFQGAEDKNKDFSGMFDRFDKLLKILQ